MQQSPPAGLRREGFPEEAFKDEFAGQQEGNFWQNKPQKPRHMKRERV